MKNNKFDSNIRSLVRKIMLEDKEGTTQEEEALLFLEFLDSTEAGSRVTY